MRYTKNMARGTGEESTKHASRIETADLARLEDAREFATQAHAGQTYGKDPETGLDRPYTYHLQEVEKILREHGHTGDILIAAWLHDIVEDTDVTLDEVRAKFGDNIADLVWRVTDEPGKNRRERKMKTYPKIAGHPDATALKLADRIANVRESKLARADLLGMYQKEWHTFFTYLKRTKIAEQMWAELFRIIFHDTKFESKHKAFKDHH